MSWCGREAHVARCGSPSDSGGGGSSLSRGCDSPTCPCAPRQWSHDTTHDMCRQQCGAACPLRRSAAAEHQHQQQQLMRGGDGGASGSTSRLTKSRSTTSHLVWSLVAVACAGCFAAQSRDAVRVAVRLRLRLSSPLPHRSFSCWAVAESSLHHPVLPWSCRPRTPDAPQ